MKRYSKSELMSASRRLAKGTDFDDVAFKSTLPEVIREIERKKKKKK
jgi:hypothetical protein